MWWITLAFYWIGLMAVFFLTCLGVGRFSGGGLLLGAPSWVWGGAMLISAATGLVIVETTGVGKDG